MAERPLLLCRLFGHKIGWVPYEDALRRMRKAGSPYPDWYAGPTDERCQRCARAAYKQQLRGGE